jgi:Spy/CpxP family protein refolding chaperone
MKVQNAVVRKTLVALIAGAGLVAFAAPSFADSPEDYPPMMRGYGPGYGMGPGMMGGYGPGSQYGRGYGPGYGMGPGMMGGYGMGPWMMRGYGPGYGMWPGMMGGCGGYGYGYNTLNLTDAQRAKIEKIQEDAARSQWEIMNKMHEAISQGWQEAQKKIDAVLTKEQREQLNRGWRGR